MILHPVQGDDNYLSIDADTNDFEHSYSVFLNSDHTEDSFEVSLWNVVGNFTFKMENLSNATIQVISNIDPNINGTLIEGNVTDLGSDNEFQYLLGSSSSIYHEFSGKFGCSDCGFSQSWNLELIEGTFANLSITYSGKNIKQNEDIPNEFAGERFTLLILIITFPILTALRRRK